VLKPHDKHHEQTIVKRGGGKHKHEDHGGAWKVAFADFCLALMCLFLVLWLMAVRNTETLEHIMTQADGSKTDVGKGVMPEQVGGPRGSLIERFPMPRTGNSDVDGNATQGYNKSPTQTAEHRVRYESPEDLKLLSKTLAKMSEDAGLAANLESIITPYGLRVMLHDTDSQGMFVRGSALPTDKFSRLLNDMGPLFAKMQNQMLIVGHTDSSQYADTSHKAFSNWNLSSNRAMTARSLLLAGSMPQDSVLQVVGMADRAPIDSKKADAGINRRIELLILTNTQALAIADMFGMPSSKTAIIRESDLPQPGLLQQLREQLLPGKGKSNGN